MQPVPYTQSVLDSDVNKNYECTGHAAESRDSQEERTGQFLTLLKMHLLQPSATVTALPIILLHHFSSILCREINLTKMPDMQVWGLISPGHF